MRIGGATNEDLSKCALNAKRPGGVPGRESDVKPQRAYIFLLSLSLLQSLFLQSGLHLPSLSLQHFSHMAL